MDHLNSLLFVESFFEYGYCLHGILYELLNFFYFLFCYAPVFYRGALQV